ncbi:MAG: hypothetical protein FWE22_01595 [Firmicutes bacterium]|nr:hypothetical protein [Bacillota bacterium]
MKGYYVGTDGYLPLYTEIEILGDLYDNDDESCVLVRLPDGRQEYFPKVQVMDEENQDEFGENDDEDDDDE